MVAEIKKSRYAYYHCSRAKAKCLEPYTREEVLEVMRDMRAHDIDMLTLGQYLQPSAHHLNVERYWTPEEFDELRERGEDMGFSNVASGPMVRSSYHADRSASQSGLV